MTTKAITKQKTQLPRDRLEMRQSSLSEKITGLRAERAKAMLEDKTFDGSALRAAEEEREAVSEAIAELRQREDEATAKTAREKTAAEEAALKERVNRLSDERLAAIEDAEASARAFVSAMSTAEAKRAELHRIVHERFGEAPLDLMVTAQMDRLSRGLCAVLKQQLGTSQFGDLRLRPGHREDRSDEPWASFEAPVLTELNRIITKENPTDD